MYVFHHSNVTERNSSRRDHPTWTAISAGWHSSPRIRFGIGKPSVASWKTKLAITEYLQLETLPEFPVFTMTNLHVNLHLEHTCPVESAYISASSSASSTDGIYAIGISWKPEKSRYGARHCTNAEHGKTRRGQLVLSESATTHIFLVFIFIREKGLLFLRLSTVLLIFASLPSCDCKTSLLYGGKAFSKSSFSKQRSDISAGTKWIVNWV